MKTHPSKRVRNNRHISSCVCDLTCYLPLSTPSTLFLNETNVLIGERPSRCQHKLEELNAVCPSQVRATDNGSPPRHTDHSLTINILDVNDNPPVIESQRGYNVSISEVGTRWLKRKKKKMHLSLLSNVSL